VWLVVAGAVAALLAPAAGAAQPAAAAVEPGDFTIALLPDTQNYVSTSANRAIMGAQTQWLVDNRAALNLAFVSHLGDIVGVSTNTTQWDFASQYLRTLDDAGVPNSVLPGNHDMDVPTGDAPLYRQHLPVSRYANASWNSPAARYGGYLGQNQFGPDPVDRQNLDNYALVTAGGMDFLILNLEFGTPDYTIDWAKRVLAAYPDRRAILVTHSYVNTAGQIDPVVQRPGGNSPAQLWQKLVSPSCSIFLVVNGHWHDGDLSEARRTDTNSCGKPVHALLSDYQERVNGGDGWLRYYTFKPSRNEIEAVTYSPTRGQFETDADSAFTMPYDMTGTTPPPPPPPVLAADSFGRTLTGGWGSADTGGPWGLASAAPRASVSGGAGVQGVPAGTTALASLSGVSSSATDLTTSFALDTVPNGTVYLTAAGRRVGTGEYGARVKVSPGGGLAVHTTRSGTPLAGGNLPGVTLAPGERWRVRVQVQGTSPTTVRARAWRAGATEPATWQATSTDSTAGLQVPGAVGLTSYLSSSATDGPLTVRYDDLLATPVGAVPPPPNLPPTASFAASASGLATTVDGSSSSDPDGTVASYAWTFGDGGTASGATAAHTYAAAGTYTVTLTVTDDDGATGTTTRQVTVSAPPTPTTLATDAFGRTVTNGWGTAEAGGAWTVGGGSTRFSVAGGTGVQTVAPGGTTTATLAGVSSTATDVVVRLSPDAAPNGAVYAYVAGRRVGSAEYGARVKWSPGGAVELHTERSTTALAGGVLAGVTLAAGESLLVRVQVTGASPTTVRTRAWKAGTAEPATWRATSTDATAALQGAGAVGVATYLSSSTTTGALALRYDDLSATRIG
jgi:PKD repeat protein